MMKRVILLISCACLFHGCALLNSKGKVKRSIVYDYDKNIYRTIKIGEQIWLRENLKVTHFNNGDPIPEIKSNVDWQSARIGAYCNYNNDTTNSVLLGRLYNFYTIVDKRGVCPIGWHVPLEKDWNYLVNYLGGKEKAGGVMKNIESNLWADIKPSNNERDTSDFNAVASGMRSPDGLFGNKYYYAYWWSSQITDSGWGRIISTKDAKIFGITHYKNVGWSIRCIKD